VAGDCIEAIPLTIVQSCKYGPTVPPKSYGKIQEISTADKKSSETSFVQEHNSAWYLLSIRYDGELTFDILPVDSMNDYDFLLYPYSDSNFCASIANRAAKPVRSNIAANLNGINRGLTGLSSGAKQDFHRQGVGEVFSRSISVKKGEKYMLVLDNVTPNGKGHTIFFHTMIRAELNGVVLGADSQPLRAEVLLSDPKGKTVSQTQTDASGRYEIKADIEKNTPYSLIFSNDSSFIGTRVVNTADTKDGHTFKALSAVLPKLKNGAKYPLGNINFYGNEARLLPESYPSVEALSRLMKKNKNMIIQIEGHVNGVGASMNELRGAEFQELSDNRAAMVRNCLIGAGIDGSRMTTIGYAAKQMLFPRAINEEQQKLNRRVEIKVISINGQ
jgi:outer membrane protein OmpA-like peptidoglycan-associated protein